MQRITDVWKNLVSVLPENGGRQSFDRGTDKGDELEESFKNLFWTRLISLQVSSEYERDERLPLTDDIIEALNALE